MDDAALLRRMWDFEQGLGEAVADRVEDVGDGFTAVLTPSLPLAWDTSYLVVESGEPSAAEIAAKAEEVLGGAGIEHRAVDFRDPGFGEELQADFEALGWKAEPSVYMGLGGDPDRPAAVKVEEVEIDAIQQLQKAATVESDDATPEVAEQLFDYARRLGEVCRDRWFAARHEGELASTCRLLQRDGIGQVEDVSTLAPARNQGLARAVVLEAVARSRADGDELTFVAGLAEDWPRKLYARLGFEDVGVIWGYVRRPRKQSIGPGRSDESGGHLRS